MIGRTNSVFMKDILAENWNSKCNIIVSGGGAVTGTSGITIKAIMYYNGYWLAAGNDSSGLVYKMYGTSQNMTTIKITSYPYDVTGIACTGDYVWISLIDNYFYNGSSTNCNTIIRCPIDTFKSTSKTVTLFYKTDGNYKYYDIVASDTCFWAVGEFNGSSVSCCNCVNGASSGQTVYTMKHGSLKKPIINCCIYNNKPFGITSDGYYTYKSSITDQYITGGNLITSGFTSKICETLGNYICVAGTKNDGTYIYYSNGTVGSLYWNHIKISDVILNPISLAYVNGLYIMIYSDSSNKTYYWISSVLGKSGICDIPSKNTSFIAKDSCVNGNTLLTVGSNGSAAYSYLFTVS